jgi:dolichyl-phosphate-mannose--protein O-mannosyl transferase
MSTLFWWIRQAGLTLIGCFFLLFGINILMLAYDQNDPFTFIITFFASNLIILISLALTIGFVCRMVRVYKQLRK